MRKQKLLILLCCLLYAFEWVGKYHYTANIIPIMEYYSVTRAQAGLIGTIFFVSYGGFQMIHACFCRFYPKREVIAGVLLASSVIDLILFFRPPFESILVLTLLNGFVHAPLWPMLLMTLGKTLDQKMMNSAVLALSFSTLLGNVLIYGGSALFNLWNVFHLIFLFSAILMLLVGTVWLFSYRALTKDRAEPDPANSGQTAPSPETTPRKTVRAAIIGLLVICTMLMIPASFIKNGLTTWAPNILKESFGFGNSISIALALGFSAFGMLGSWIAVLMHKRIPEYCSLVGVLFLLLTVCCGATIPILRESGLILFLICAASIAVLASAIQNLLTSVMPLAMRDQVNSGFLTGLMNSASCVGGAASTYGMGWLADGGGWDAVFRILFITSAVSTVAAVAAVVFRLIHAYQERKAGTTVIK